MKITFGDILIARGQSHHEEPLDLSITTQRLVQETQLMRATHAAPIDRGNLLTRITFSVTRQHNSADTAREFSLTHASTLSGLATDAHFTDETSPRNRSFTLSNAVISQISLTVNGTTTTAAYDIRGGAIS